MQVRKLVIKVIVAGIIAFLILSFFSFFYYNVPIHYDSETRSTDYVWEANKTHFRGTEGFSYGKTDSNGFNNISVPEKVDILMMGSSQMEGFNVAPTDNTTSKLNELFSNKLTAYNIGVSGHTLAVCLNNLENAIKEFSPQKYIVIEAQNFMTHDELDKLYNENIERIPSVNTGVLSTLQKSDYLRLLYLQYKSYKNANQANTNLATNTEKLDFVLYESQLNEVLKDASNLAMEASCQLIIFFDDALKFNDRGEILPREKNTYYQLLEKACKENNIIFIDMYEPFLELFNTEYRLPHGFSNTRVGIGHLNKYGHLAIAKTIYEVINEKEGLK